MVAAMAVVAAVGVTSVGKWAKAEVQQACEQGRQEVRTAAAGLEMEVREAASVGAVTLVALVKVELVAAAQERGMLVVVEMAGLVEVAEEW